MTTGSATSSSSSSSTTTSLGSLSAPAVFVAPYATINVKNHIPVTLELTRPNFNQWEPFFTSLCGKFGLLSHITEEAGSPDPAWNIADACVRSWLLGSVGPDVLGLATAPDQTARALWLAIRRLFEANKAPRAIFLGHEFYSMTQGDSPVNDYTQKMKATADALRDVGRVITDSELVLNFLRGLNPRFASTADNIADSHPLPDFATTREKLVLKELRLANEGTVAAQTAFHAACGTACRTVSSATGGSFTGYGGGSSSGGSSGGKGGGNGRWKKKGKGGAPKSAASAAPWLCYPPWTAAPHQQPWRPPAWGGSGVLGAPPPAQAHTAFAPAQFSGATNSSLPPHQQQGGWDQAGLIAALNQMSLQGSSPWVFDTGATAHMSSSDGILLSRLPPPPSGITVGDGTTIPITCRGPSRLHSPHSTFHLHDVLVAPALVRNLLSVRQFTRDNACSVEFDSCGFSIKDQQTGRVTLRCNSGGDLYTFPTTPSTSCSLATTSSLWHRRLGHPGPSSLATLRNMSAISYNKHSPCLCHACQLGKHARLPFSHSTSVTSAPFDLLHCDVWTSPVPSNSGFKYYLVILDDFSHYCWTFPLRHKSEVHRHLVEFFVYATTQFGTTPKSLQADNGTEFVNHATATLLSSQGTTLRLSCPYTSPQNGKAERILRTINNTIRTMLLHAFMPPPYWAEALTTATTLLNRRPSSIHHQIPHQILYGTPRLLLPPCLRVPLLSKPHRHLPPQTRSSLRPVCFPRIPILSQGLPLPRHEYSPDNHLSPCHIRRVGVPIRSSTIGGLRAALT